MSAPGGNDSRRCSRRRGGSCVQVDRCGPAAVTFRLPRLRGLLEILPENTLRIPQEKRIGGWYDKVRFPAFSPNGSTMAFIATEGTEEFVVKNGKEGPRFDRIRGGVQFVPDGSMLYLGVKGKSQHLVRSGRPDRVFAPGVEAWLDWNGNIVAEKIELRNGIEIQWRGRREGPYDEILASSVSRHGNHLFYAARRGDEYFVIREGTEEGPFPSIEVEGQTYSMLAPGPRGKNVAFAVKEGDEYFMMAGGRRSGPYTGITGPYRFSRDGRKLGFGASEGGGLWWKVLDLGGP